MASNISISSGSPCIGSPITMVATSASLAGTISFHRVKVDVIAALIDSTGAETDAEYTQLSLSAPVTTESGKTEVVTIDVSSALRAVADRFVFSPTPSSGTVITFPSVKWQLKVYDEYMQGGEVHTTSAVYYPSNTTYLKSIFGKFSELERVKSTTGFKTVQYLSRKPATCTEVVGIGEQVVVPVPFKKAYSLADLSVYAKSNIYTITKAGVQDLGNEATGVPRIRHTIYAVAPNSNDERYSIRFVNSMGCLESVSVLCLRSSTMKSEGTRYMKSLNETFSTPQGSFYRKKNDCQQWKMSTGVVDEDWCEWFAHDVMMTPQAWILIDSVWVPCHIETDDSISLGDRSKNSLSAMEFTLSFDLNGSLSSALLL